MATSTTVSHAEETDVGVIFTTQPPPNQSWWTTKASDPKIFTYLNSQHHAAQHAADEDLCIHRR